VVEILGYMSRCEALVVDKGGELFGCLADILILDMELPIDSEYTRADAF
jgi:hypothetical protein